MLAQSVSLFDFKSWHFFFFQLYFSTDPQFGPSLHLESSAKRKRNGKWQHLSHFMESFGTGTEHLWCSLFTSASSVQSLYIRLAFFPPFN